MTLKGTGRQGPDPRCGDAEWVAAYLDEVSQGAMPYLASEVHGISRITLWKWLRLGGYSAYAHHREFVPPDEAREPYRTFVELTLQAEARAHLDIVKTVHRKVGNDMNAAIKYMRTRYAEQYDPRNVAATVDVSEGATRTVLISLENFDRMRQEAGHGSSDES